MADQRLLKRFWNKVDVREPENCWEWLAYRNQYGYGQFWFENKKVNATRVVMFIRGYDVQDKMVCHHCDNRACVNPNHLYLGDQKENMEDAVERGRIPTGEDHGRSKLSDLERMEIRRRYHNEGVSMRDLANEYDVAPSTISYTLNHQGN